MCPKNKKREKLEETHTEISYNCLGLDLKLKKVTRIIETIEGQDALDKHCGDLSAKLRDLCAKIGVDTSAIFVADLIREGLK